MSISIKPSELTPGSVLINMRPDAGNYALEVVTRSHTLYADEPEDMGGNNSGASPFEYLMASIGTCTAMTLKMYASMKKLTLPEMAIAISHQQEKNSEGNPVMKITRELVIEGDIEESLKEKLIEIAEKCPVHKALSGEITFDTHLVSLPIHSHHHHE